MFEPTSTQSPVLARLRGHSRKKRRVGIGMFRNGVPVRELPVAVSRIVLQQGGDQIVVRPPVQVVVLRAEQQKEVIQAGVGDPAFPADPEPERLLHRGFRFRLQAAGEMRALRVEEAECPHIVGDGKEGPRRVSWMLRGWRWGWLPCFRVKSM